MRSVHNVSLRLGILLLACAACVCRADISFPIGPEGASSVFAISHDGKLLLSSGTSNSLQIWDIGTSKVLRTIPHPEPFGEAAFSADDKLIATWSDNDPPFSYPINVGLWEVETGKARELAKSDRGHWFSDDLAVYATTDTAANQVILWETASGKQIAKWTRTPEEKGELVRIFIAPRPHAVLTIAHQGKWSQLVARDPVAGSSKLLDNQDGIVYSAGFGVEEKTAFAGLQWGRNIQLQPGGFRGGPSDEEFSFGVRQWDLSSGKRLSDWKGEKEFGNARILFAPQCQTCAVECTAGSFEGGSLTLRDPASGRVISRIFDGPSNISGNPGIKDLQNTAKTSAVVLGYAPAGGLLAVGYGGPSVDFVDSATGKALKTVQAKSWSVGWSAFSPDGKMFGISELIANLLPGQPFRELIQLVETAPAPGEQPMHRDPPPPKPDERPRPRPPLPAVSRSSRIGVANFSDQPVTDIRIEGVDPKNVMLLPRCNAKQSLPPQKSQIDAAAFLKITFDDDQHRRHQSQFTRPDFGCGDGTDEHLTYTLYVGFDHQSFIRTSLSDAYRDNDRWHVPDDRAGHITAKAMNEPQLVGIGPNDPFFDITLALVRYPVYDELTLCRPGDYVTGGGTTECDGLIIRDIPQATNWFVTEVREHSLMVVADGRSLELMPATDTGALPLPATQPLYRPAPKRESPFHKGPVDILANVVFGKRKMQGLGVSNWGAKQMTDLRIQTSNGSYKWSTPMRPGGGQASMSVTELTLSGKIHLTYVDGNGASRTADFENVPEIGTASDPQRMFFFDAGYNALLHCYDIADDFTRGDDKWLLSAGSPKPDEPLALPQYIGIGELAANGAVYRALIRYPRNDSIAEYTQTRIIGGDYYDASSHDTPDGVPRYRIESITTTEMVLVRDGKRISVPLMKDSAGK
ncbi:MAG TPA: WD40 repeat domain-containing protein [Humisphaera sp.]|nr:WD40 repeat domain-containing protein [Humisphaera sp.]